MNRTLLVTALALAVAGCSDPKAANNANFEKAIQAQLDQSYPKCYVTQNFPAVIEFDVGGQRRILAALVKGGLVAATEKEVNAASFGNLKLSRTVTEYTLTDAGRKHYTADATKNLRGDPLGGFCFGKAEVTRIDEFTEPADMMGARVSRVHYRYQVEQIPAWAKADDLLDALPALKNDVATQREPGQAHAVLVLTSNGWRHEVSARR